MLYIQRHFPTTKYESAFRCLWTCYWNEHMDISKPDTMAQCLRRNFDEGETKKILEAAATKEYKEMLTQQTARLVEKGAFGAPWFLVTNGEGTEQGFFGSDR